MKKKLLISLLALSGVAALASCGENDKPNSTTSSGSAMSIESSKSTPSKSSESSKSTPSSTPAPAPSSSSSPSSAPTPSTSSTPSTPTPSTSATPSTPSETTSSSVEVKAKVTFDVDGEKNEVQVDKGNTVTKPSDPVKEGYVFVGWFNGEEEFDFSTPILTDEVNLVAKFRELTNRELFYKDGEVLYYSEFDEDSDVTYSTNGGEGLTGFAQNGTTKENLPFSDVNVVNIANGRLNLVDIDTTITTYASIDVNDVYLDKVTFVCDLIPGKVAGKWSMVTFVDANGSEFASIRTTSDKKLGMRVAGVEPTTGVAYTENQSMRVVVVIDLCDGNISATIDGTAIASDAKINVDNFSGVKFGTAKDARNLSLDNVGIKKEACSLETAKTKMKANANAIYEAYDFTKYQANQENITNAYNQTNTTIDEANTINEVRNALEAFKEALKAYLSDEEIAFNDSKIAAIEEVSSYLDANNYTYSIDLVNEKINAARDKITNATTSELINEIVTSVKAELDEIPNDTTYLVNLKAECKTNLEDQIDSHLETAGFAEKIAEYKAIIDSKTTKDEVIEAYNTIKLEIEEIPSDIDRAQAKRNEALIELYGTTNEFSEDLLTSEGNGYRTSDILALKDANNDVYQLIVNVLIGAKERLGEALKTSDVNDVLVQIKEEIDNAIASTTKSIEEVREDALTEIKDYATEELGKDTFNDFAKLSEAINASDNVAVINQIVLDGKDIVNVLKYISSKGAEVEEAFNTYEDASYKAFASSVAQGFYEEEFAILLAEEGRYAYDVDKTTANIDTIVEFYKTNKAKLVKDTTEFIDEYFNKFTNAQNETVAACVTNLTTFKEGLATSMYVANFAQAKNEEAIATAFTNATVDINSIMDDANNLTFEATIYITSTISSKYSVKYGEKINLDAINKEYKAKNILVEGLYLNAELNEAFDLKTAFYDMSESYTLYAKAYDINVETTTENYGFINPTVLPASDDVFTYTWNATKAKTESKKFTDTDGTALTNAIKTGGKAQIDNNIKVTLTAKSTIRVVFYSGGSSSRSVFIGKSASSTLDSTIASATSTSTKDLQVLEVELAAGEYYVNFNNSVGISRLQAIVKVEKTTVYNSLDVTNVKTEYASGDAIDLAGLKANKIIGDVTSLVDLTKEEMAKVTYSLTNEAGEVATELITGRYKVSVKFMNITTVEFWITVL